MSNEKQNNSSGNATEPIVADAAGSDSTTRSVVAGDISRRAHIGSMTELREFSGYELDELKILHPGMSDRRVLNAFRDLRTKLLQRSRHDNFICMVTSLGEGGGASYVSANLAAAFALDKAKTSLLIDCNLYDPSVNKLLSVDAEYGVTDFLDDGSLDVQDIIYASGIPRLRGIPVGSNREGGAEHFSSQRMNLFIKNVKNRYPDRFIVADAPCINTSAEARILADLCDLVVLVVPYGKVGASQILSGIEKIDKDKLVGLVLNDA